MNSSVILRTRQCLAELGVPADFVEKHDLPAFAEADELVVAEVTDTAREHWLSSLTAEAWKSMRARATEGGGTMHIVSAFCSFKHQRRIIASKIDAGHSMEGISAHLGWRSMRIPMI